MNWSFWRELKIAFDAIAVDPDCHVVILTGRGKSFTAGLDLSDSRNLPPPAKDCPTVRLGTILETEDLPPPLPNPK
eukprot:209484-Amphidinium_carterae.1